VLNSLTKSVVVSVNVDCGVPSTVISSVSPIVNVGLLAVPLTTDQLAFQASLPTSTQVPATMPAPVLPGDL
jgi:hypothetical protein